MKRSSVTLLVSLIILFFLPGLLLAVEVYVPDEADNAGARITETFTRSSPGTVFPGYATHVKAIGSMVYVSGSNSLENNFQIIDASVPENPQIISTTDYGLCGSDLSVVDQTAYVGQSAIDISDPSNPRELGYIGSRPGECYYGTDVVGDNAYVLTSSMLTYRTPYLWVFDATDFSRPDKIASITIPSWGNSVTKINQTAYITYKNGVVLIDVSEPSEPRTIASFSTSGNAMDIDVAGDIACVADGDKGLQIVDLSEQSSPQIISTVNTPGTARSVKIMGHRAFVADGESGVQIVDIEDPFFPKITGSIYTQEDALDVDVVAETAYIACGSSGLLVMPLPQPDPEIAIEFSNNIPDPANGVSQISIVANTMGNIAIETVEFFMDHIGAEGTSFPMTPNDGTFDGMSEEVSAIYTIPENWTSGRHTVYARARDTSGLWHDFYQYTLIYTLPGVNTLLVPQTYASIQDAVDSAGDGDMVIVAQGKYNESIDIDKEISIIGRDQRKTVIYGEGDHRGFYVRADNVTISGFTLNDCESQGIRITGASHCHIDTVIINNVVGYWKGPGYGIYLTNSSDNILENLEITNVQGSSAWTAYAGYGIKLENSSDNLIKNSSISNITSGTGLYDSLGSAYGIHLSDSNNVTVSGIRIDYIRNREQFRAINCSNLLIQGTTLDRIYLEGNTTAIVGGSPDATNRIFSLENHTSNSIDATYNNWDSTSPDDENIIDKLDDESLGRVNSEHWIYDSPPDFLSRPIIEATAGYLYTYEILASDPDGEEVEFQCDNLPDWLTLENTANNTAILSGIPSKEDVGSSVNLLIVVMTKKTVEKNSTQSFTLKVLPNIFFAQLPSGRLYEGKKFSGVIEVGLIHSGSDIEISVSGYPQWIDFIDNGDGTARLLGTPPTMSNGENWNLDITINAGTDVLKYRLYQEVFPIDSAKLWNVAKPINDVAVKDDIAFAVSNIGLHIIDGNGVQIGQFLGAGGSQVAIAGDRLIVSENSTFGIIDISSPQDPILLKVWNLDSCGSSYSFYFEDEIVYAVCPAYSHGGGYLFTIDVSDPYNADLLSSFSFHDHYRGCNSTRDAYVEDKILYIYDECGLGLIDITDPSKPIKHSTQMSLDELEMLFDYWDTSITIHALDSYLYIIGNVGEINKLYVISKNKINEAYGPYDSSNSGVIEADWSIELPQHNELNKPVFLDVKDGLAYLTSTVGGAQTIDVSSSGSTAIIKDYSGVSGQINNIAVGENRIYIVGENGLYVIPSYNANDNGTTDDTLNAPDMTLTRNNNIITVSWTAISEADGYTLFYAPWPNAEYVSSIDMGLHTSFSFDATIFALYVAVQANSDVHNMSSNLSNIEFFNPQ